MLFNTLQFFCFLIVVLVLFYASPRNWRKYVLLLASYFFYASWNPKFIPLLLTLTTIDYCAGIWIESARPERRKLALILSVGANLLFLGFFKYYNFLGENAATLMGMPPRSFWRDIVLPLGISFHTFQSMSYVVDVYRRQQVAIRNPVDYALFISFFPQLVAGPIVRAREFFRDLLGWHQPNTEDFGRGLFLLMIGLTKKMAFADQFAIIADSYFSNPAASPGLLPAWSGAFAFGMQIYFDFSGYTDMAIGMAQLFGFHFPVNFRRPYLASSITDFWRRWHITLSSWLRDYLYIPLGGNRHGLLLTYRNLLLTMLLGGLWHGASWNFIIWGAYHGTLLSIERMMRGSEGTTEARGWLYPIRALLTFAFVLMGWVFFRSKNLPDSIQIFRQMFAGSPGKILLEPWHFGLVGIALALALAEEHSGWIERMMRAPTWVYASGLSVMFFFLEIFGVVDVSIPFVYFQF
jgi:alginate O-acetyltransferase complex protein AlgI